MTHPYPPSGITSFTGSVGSGSVAVSSPLSSAAVAPTGASGVGATAASSSGSDAFSVLMLMIDRQWELEIIIVVGSSRRWETDYLRSIEKGGN
jgi:hypothetical protein